MPTRNEDNLAPASLNDIRLDLAQQAAGVAEAYDILSPISEIWDDPDDAKRVEGHFQSINKKMLAAMNILEEHADRQAVIDEGAEAVTALHSFYSRTFKEASEFPVNTSAILEHFTGQRESILDSAQSAINQVLFVEDSEEKPVKIYKEPELQPEPEVENKEMIEQAEELAAALQQQYDKFGLRSNNVDYETYGCITQAAARGRISVAKLVSAKSNESLNTALDKLLPNALQALPSKVEERLIGAQKALVKHPMAIGRRSPLWKMEDEAQEIAVAKIATQVAEEIALNVQISGVEGAPQVAEPRFFKTPEERSIGDFQIGDEVFCSPYVANKKGVITGLSNGQVIDIKTSAKKGTRVIVEVVKPNGIITQYSYGFTNNHLIHKPCWNAFRHSKALRQKWQKVTSAIQEDTSIKI